MRCLDKNKNDIWYKTTIFIKRDIKGNILGYAAKRQDITDKKKLENLSITDTLTNLYNRRFFDEIVRKEINRARRMNKNFILMMIDIDNFKKYNDTFGHLYGDNILKKVAIVLKRFTKRANDFAFRLGGDEFSIISMDFDKDKILIYSNKIKEEITKLKFKNNICITISIGVYILEQNEKTSLKEIFKFSDEALYKAKNLGKNQVVVYL
ncbi:diguanylate cyclase [Aliarcobacter vitoriensis]|uniref:GGDEF domain-containing protein n=1 Tax=Aliarcobacter vitoriensis TaxID=2011099 RepID=UPI003AB01EF1